MTRIPKIAIFGVAISFIMTASAAHAQTASVSMMTTAQIQTQLATLEAQLAAAQGGSAMTSTSVSSTASMPSMSMTFTRNLTLGSSGPDVTALQSWLIGKGFSISAGATGYFGAQTQSSLARYQASVGISPATGYFGVMTRGRLVGSSGMSTTMSTTPPPAVMMVAGCTAGAAYSTTSGQSCSGVASTPSTSTSFSANSTLDAQMSAIQGLETSLNGDLTQTNSVSQQDDSGN